MFAAPGVFFAINAFGDLRKNKLME